MRLRRRVFTFAHVRRFDVAVKDSAALWSLTITYAAELGQIRKPDEVRKSDRSPRPGD